METSLPEKLSDADLVEALTHTHLAECYQCGKCTAGCPMAAAMDVMPNQLVRMLQLGHSLAAMSADAIWACVSCQTCSTRCPKSVDCAGIMDALRELSLRQGVASPAQHQVVAFQRAFLENIRRNGRLDEIELIAEFKLRVLRREPSLQFLFKDARLAPALQKRGKFHLRGEKVKDRALVRRIFARCAVRPIPDHGDVASISDRGAVASISDRGAVASISDRRRRSETAATEVGSPER